MNLKHKMKIVMVLVLAMASSLDASQCFCKAKPGGCIIIEAAPVKMACKCSLDLGITCTSEIVDCANPNNEKCKVPGTGILSCIEGGGNCGGYNVTQTSFSDSGSTNTDINNGDDTFLNLLKTSDFQQQQFSSSCSLPEGGTGTCGSLRQCGAYRSFLTSLDNQNILQYLKARLCRVETTGAFVCCPPPPTSSSLCGRSSGFNVVGGTELRDDEYPWLVAIGSPGIRSFSVSCGGSLITRKHVLTAAHCWDFSSPSHVRVGEHDLNNDRDGVNPQDIQIASRSIHPMYNKDLSENDVAIATLEKDVRFDSYIVEPICLPFRDNLKNSNFEGKHMHVVGWGKTDEGSGSRTTVTRARKVLVKVHSINKCQPVYKDVRNISITGKQLCAVGDGVDSCQGDSGNPLNYLDLTAGRYYLAGIAGITSTGGVCAPPGTPTRVYVRVGAYLDWILWIVSNVL